MLLRFIFCTVPIVLWDAFSLLMFVLLLAPGFAQFAWYYWVVANRRSVKYGDGSCRQSLDVYMVDGEGTSSDRGNREGQHNSLRDLEAGRQEGEAPTASTPFLLPPRGTTGRPENESTRPVVVYLTGGAWLIGYKMWGALLARTLSSVGVVVVVPDYRNYPLACVPDMMDDVNDALQWTLDNVDQFGGDPKKVVVVGQSAGGHLACAAMLLKAIGAAWRSAECGSRAGREAVGPGDTDSSSGSTGEEDPPVPSFSATDFCAFVSLSAPYNMDAMQDTFAKHGMNQGMTKKIFGGDVPLYDPSDMLKKWKDRSVSECDRRQLVNYIPPMRIYHGTGDKTVPFEGSERFSELLEEAGADVKFTAYEGWSHTDPILEGPMDADHRFHKDLYNIIEEFTGSQLGPWPEEGTSSLRRLCPHIIVRISRFFMPF